MVVKRFDIWLIRLDPTVGSEIQKTRPCVIISPDEINTGLNTVIAAPMISAIRHYPSRLEMTFQNKRGQIVLDQLRTFDKSRLVKKIGTLSEVKARALCSLLIELFSYE